MPSDASLAVRREGVTRLKANAPLGAVDADSVYPPRRPANVAWPFVGWGAPIVTPTAIGADIAVAVHAYDEGPDEQGVSETLAACKEALDPSTDQEGTVWDLGADGKAHVFWQQSQVMQDGSAPSRWHGFASLRISVIN